GQRAAAGQQPQRARGIADDVAEPAADVGLQLHQGRSGGPDAHVTIEGVGVSGSGSDRDRASSTAPSTSADGWLGSDSMWATIRSTASSTMRRISGPAGSNVDVTQSLRGSPGDRGPVMS